MLLPSTQMRIALLLVAGFVAGCPTTGLTGTEARVQVDDRIDFGRAYVGETAKANLEVRSTGSSWFRVLSVIVDGAPVAIDRAVAAGGESVPPGGVATFELRWSPVLAGALDATATVTVDVEGAAPFEVKLLGDGRVPPDCDDANPCTDDGFVRATESCTHVDNERACEDGSACTVEDRCVAGTCRGVARSCDDDDVCTQNLCDPAVGCVFPPDGRTCDDGDPCTRDVCDRDDGCSHPDAETGTMCGAFSCSIAHVCVLGKCRELDVTGASDDLPCFDGDLCTDGDACDDGRCVPGPRIQAAPSVVARVETFGGAGSLVGTDGFRYLFTGDGVVEIVTSDGTKLERRSSIGESSDVAPVDLGSGRFLLAKGGELVLVDATDVANPLVSWRIPIRALNTELRPGATLVTMSRTPTGVLIASASELASTPGRSFVAHVPISATFDPPTTLELIPVHEVLRDLAGDEASVVLTGPLGAFWIDRAHGNAEHSLARLTTGTPAAVALFRDRIAVLETGQIRVFEWFDGGGAPVPCLESSATCRMLGPGCGNDNFPTGFFTTCSDTTSCPSDTNCRQLQLDTCPTCDVDCASRGDCCSPSDIVGVCLGPGTTREVRLRAMIPAPGARDVAIDEQLVAWVSDEGVFALDLTATSGRVTVDPFSFSQIALHDGSILASGPLALPLQRRMTRATTMPLEWTRLVGLGQGDVTTITDSALPRVLLGGPTALGELDLLTKAIVSWGLLPPIPGLTQPRLLVGPTRTTVIDERAWDDGDDATEPCPGVELGLVSRAAIESVVSPCALHSAHFDVAGNRLWAATDEMADIMNRMQPVVLRSWGLAPFTPAPVLATIAPQSLGRPSIRGADRGTAGAIVQRWQDLGTLQKVTVVTFDGTDTTATPTQQLGYLPSGRPALPSRETVGIDGNHALVSDERGVSLFAFEPVSSTIGVSVPRSTLTLNVDLSTEDPRVLWMADERAWVGFSQLAGDEGPVTQLLSEVHYDRATERLSTLGTVDLGGRVLRAYDTGVYTIATTPGAVSVIAPACR